MKKMTSGAVAFAAASAIVLAGCSSSGSDEEPTTDATDDATTEEATETVAQDITLWLMGAPDTPEPLVTYLQDTYAENNGGTLTVEAVAWSDALPKLTTALPDAANTPDVVEIGNTWAPTFTSVGAFSDLSDIYDELGGDDLLPSFTEVGSVDGTPYALPYYFGSRNMWARTDIYEAGGVEVPTTLAEVTEVHASLKDKGLGGLYLGGQDWRNAISWIFAHGGDLAAKDGDQWVSTLSSAESQEGIAAWQEMFETASIAQANDTDADNYFIINDGTLANIPAAASMAPSWASCCIGTPVEGGEEGEVAWDDTINTAYGLPGVDGGLAPVFAGGSNIGISATSENQEGSRDLLRIIFSDDFQAMLGENGLGPANVNAKDSFVTDDFRQIAWDTAQVSKLTPAAPGWASVEGSGLLEEFFQAVAEGGDVAALAAEYDEKITAQLNG
ncbi:extracellular solute-binding protein [Demequina activiva]|uniref:Sugar ABC transporter substrate-binding protein n=1 Tax=Demequina activiva TaxID=1582364 RepID=A0A919Q2A5_9MICO|nr:extracellular solute-binding protein [Demequina activiva]GIG54724.1 sugar ABC transporter substrate-binding protein [Demequina activiva]